MLPRGLQQNKTLISLNVIVISYSSEKQHGYWGLSLEMSNEEQFTTRCLSGHLHAISQTNMQIRCDSFGAAASAESGARSCKHGRLWYVLKPSKQASVIEPVASLSSFINRLHLISYCLLPPSPHTHTHTDTHTQTHTHTLTHTHTHTSDRAPCIWDQKIKAITENAACGLHAD